MFQAMKRGGMTAMFVGHGKFFLGTGWYWMVLDGTGWYWMVLDGRLAES